MIDRQALVYRLSRADGDGRAVHDPERTAQAVLWLLGAEALSAAHFHRIAAHHRIRRRNLHARVRLRLVLVQHGDSYRAPPPPSSPAGRNGHVGAARELLPEGWAQVTRTAWELRSFPAYVPDLVLTSSVKCCQQTAERLRALADHAGCVLATVAPDLMASLKDGQEHGKPYPEAVACPQLDFPEAGAPSLAMLVYSLAESVVAALQRNSDDGDDDGGDLAPPPVVLLVAGGAALEALLGCLNAGLPPALRPTAMAAGRLLGGDAVLLESPTLFRIVGDSEEEERLKPLGELWGEGLRRKGWMVRQHVTGDGRRPWGAVRQGMPQRATEPESEEPERSRSCTLREEWKRYCGEPLILSHADFSRLCVRAGTVRPLSPSVTNAVRSLVYGFKPRPEAPASRPASGT